MFPPPADLLPVPPSTTELVLGILLAIVIAANMLWARRKGPRS